MPQKIHPQILPKSPLPQPTPRSGDADFFKHWAMSNVDSDVDQIIDHSRRQDRQQLDTSTDESVPDDSEDGTASAMPQEQPQAVKQPAQSGQFKKSMIPTAAGRRWLPS